MDGEGDDLVHRAAADLRGNEKMSSNLYRLVLYEYGDMFRVMLSVFTWNDDEM